MTEPLDRAKARVVFVTGATSGIGEATARAFRERGARLVLVGRNEAALSKLQAELEDVHAIALDVRDRAGLEKAIADLPPAFRDVDVLVNNAGLALGVDKAQNASGDDWDVMIDTNVRAFVHVTRLLLPGMVERNRGHIIAMGSVAGTYPYPGATVYGASKAFTEQFALMLRADLHGTRVRVTSIEPGAVETGFSEVRFKGDKSKAADVYRGLEALTAKDIADVVCFCADLPERVNVNRLELMSIAQSFAGFAFHRSP
ncbi:MAG: SDR family NAD(P)-dependent oxidoreductase [Polyangiaceae bacterium]